MNPAAVAVDVVDFERLAAKANPETLERAALLYRGDLLEGLRLREPAFEEWLAVERDRLRSLAVATLDRLTHSQMEGGDLDAAIETATRLVSLDPTREAGHRTLMRLHLQTGRRAAAVRQYQACERALSRRTQGGLLADKQLVQAAIADSWMQLAQLRLMVLYTAWVIDQNATAGARKEIAACKVLAANVLHDIVYRAMHLHGALGVTDEMPLARMWQALPSMGIVDGPTEVHQVTIARQLLKDREPSQGTWPSRWLPPRVEESRQRYADAIESVVGNL